MKQIAFVRAVVLGKSSQHAISWIFRNHMVPTSFLAASRLRFRMQNESQENVVLIHNSNRKCLTHMVHAIKCLWRGFEHLCKLTLGCSTKPYRFGTNLAKHGSPKYDALKISACIKHSFANLGTRKFCRSRGSHSLGAMAKPVAKVDVGGPLQCQSVRGVWGCWGSRTISHVRSYLQIRKMKPRRAMLFVNCVQLLLGKYS